MSTHRWFTPHAALLAASLIGAAPVVAQVAAPANVTATPMKGYVVVSWRGVRDATVSYRVLRGPDAVKPGQDLTKPLPADATYYNDGLAIDGTVYYTVVAVYRDGSEGASLPVQYPAAATATSVTTVAPMPTATVSSQLTSGVSLKLGPAPVLSPTPVSSTWKDFRVTLTWAPVQTAAPEPVTYMVRHSPYDPATVPPSYQPGYVSGTAALKNGFMTLVDAPADREKPSWYMVVATSTSQGSVNFPWYRQNPPLHHGVDTIIGHYWHTTSAQYSGWTGCVRGSPATDAMAYIARIKVGSVGWITMQTAPLVNGQPAGPGMNVGRFDTGGGGFRTLKSALDGGYIPVIQMYPIVWASYMQGPAGLVTVPDSMHLAPLVYSVTQSQTPFDLTTCQ